MRKWGVRMVDTEMMIWLNLTKMYVAKSLIHVDLPGLNFGGSKRIDEFFFTSENGPFSSVATVGSLPCCYRLNIPALLTWYQGTAFLCFAGFFVLRRGSNSSKHDSGANNFLVEITDFHDCPLGIASAKTSSLYRYIMSCYKPRTQLCNSGASWTSCRGVISLVLQTTEKTAIFLVILSSISNSCSTTDRYHLPSYPIIPWSVSNRLGQERLKKAYLRDCDNRFRVVKKRD